MSETRQYHIQWSIPCTRCWRERNMCTWPITEEHRISRMTPFLSHKLFVRKPWIKIVLGRSNPQNPFHIPFMHIYRSNALAHGYVACSSETQQQHHQQQMFIWRFCYFLLCAVDRAYLWKLCDRFLGVHTPPKIVHLFQIARPLVFR